MDELVADMVCIVCNQRIVILVNWRASWVPKGVYGGRTKQSNFIRAQEWAKVSQNLFKTSSENFFFFLWGLGYFLWHVWEVQTLKVHCKQMAWEILKQSQNICFHKLSKKVTNSSDNGSRKPSKMMSRKTKQARQKIQNKTIIKSLYHQKRENPATQKPHRRGDPWIHLSSQTLPLLRHPKFNHQPRNSTTRLQAASRQPKWI